MTPRDVLDFWFGAPDPAHPHGQVRAMWFKKDPEFDAALLSRFGDTWTAACRGELDEWLETAEGTLALVIVLDQFSRNLCRDDPRAWAQDPRALEIALDALDRGIDEALPHFGKTFLYMPLMHAEDRGIQARSVACFEKFVAGAPDSHKEGASHTLNYAQTHKDIVDRFGRYPHRNAILRRESTQEELEFLEGPDSSF